MLLRRHGTKTIHVRVRNGGLIGQWLESWWPNSDSEAAIVLEDDLSVSKYYYRWCKKAIAKYLWDPANFDPHAYGISLQRQYVIQAAGAASARLRAHHTHPPTHGALPVSALTLPLPCRTRVPIFQPFLHS